MSTPRRAPSPAERIDSVFVFDLNGRAYELPAAIALEHQVTAERLAFLGHLPGEAPQGSVADEPEVGGRHRAMSSSGLSAFHADVRFGTYLWSDGQCYRGDHFHPYGDERAEPA